MVTKSVQELSKPLADDMKNMIDLLSEVEATVLSKGERNELLEKLQRNLDCLRILDRTLRL